MDSIYQDINFACILIVIAMLLNVTSMVVMLFGRKEREKEDDN